MWKTCGHLLILSALVTSNPCQHKKKPRYLCNLAGIITNSQSPTNSNNENYKNGMFILGNDGFTGFLEIGSCTNDRWIGLRQCPSNESLAQTLNISLNIFPIDQNASCIGNQSCTTRISDYGVSFIRPSPYKLNISRNVVPTFVCFIEGHCKPNIWSNWITEDCKWTHQNTKYFKNDNCTMICMNHKKTCEEASYDPKCSILDPDVMSNINSFEIHNGSVTCLKCGSPLQVLPNISVSSNISNLFNKNRTDAGAAVMIMKSLSNLLDVMGNLTEASVTMGAVTGVLQKIQHESQIKESAFIYSPETGIRILADTAELKNFPNAFIVPKEAAQKAFNNSAGTAFLGVFRFPKMTQDANNSTVLNDEVYAIEMGTPISDLNNTINLNFKKAQEVPGTPKCHSWDGNGSNPNWTTEGCHTVVVGDKIICKCKHLTFFAVLMAPNIIVSSSDLVSLTYITYIGCGLSMFFLGVGLFMHFLINKKKSSDSVIVLMNLFMALFMLNLAFLVNEYVVRAKNLNICRVMAAFMHYCLLSSFSWFAVEALHLCLQMAKNSVTIKHYIIKISMAGWVPPALFVSILFVMGKYGEKTIETENSNVTMCWILDSTVHYVVNIGYYCFVFILTFGSFIVVLRWLSMLKLVRWNNAGKVRRSGITTIDISTILALCCLLGLTWSISFFSYGALQIPSYYVFTILNSLQGFFLFIYYLKTSTLFGDPVPSETSDTTEETKTENPYDNTVKADDNLRVST